MWRGGEGTGTAYPMREASRAIDRVAEAARAHKEALHRRRADELLAVKRGVPGFDESVTERDAEDVERRCECGAGAARGGVARQPFRGVASGGEGILRGLRVQYHVRRA